MQIVEALIALVTLTAMEIVLGIDNIVFIAILTDRLPREQQPFARRLGLGVALGSRLLLLMTLKAIMGLTDALFEWTSIGLPRVLFPEDEHAFAEINGVSLRDIILLVGGLFLIGKSVHEIHTKMDGAEHERSAKTRPTLMRVITEIAVMDIVFSLDSVITAVGVMLIFADVVSRFIERHQTLKMLALSFLLLIGVMLMAEAIGTQINKGYIYFAMAFSLLVEFLNIRTSAKEAARKQAARADD